MTTLEDARKLIDKSIMKLPATTVQLSDAVGCRLNEDIKAANNVPDFKSSAMDGYAIRHADLKGDGPWRLPVQMIIAAGDYTDESLSIGHAAKIMTGAPLIDGADTVIPVEDVEVDSEYVVIKNRPDKNKFVRPKGDDIIKGTRLFGKGDKLDAIDLGIIASVGLNKVKIIPRPRIGLLSTGSEIIEPGKKLNPGQIYNSNDILLQAMLTMDGQSELISKDMVLDKTGDFKKTIGRYLENCDLIITSGAVSMGDFDFIPQVVIDLGGKVLFHKVSTKPGKPTLVAKIGEKWLVGLPGNPVSALAGYHLYVRRIISLMKGEQYFPETDQAILVEDLTIRGTRYCLVGARLEKNDNGITAYPAVRQKSGRLSSIKNINGFIMIEGGNKTVPKGETVNIEWLTI